MSFFKKYLSFLWDLPVENGLSKLNPGLEVVWSMGQLMLNSETANYSHGNLHKVFRFAIKQIDWDPTKIDRVLVLGFGGGSIADILYKEYHYKGAMTGVEHDPEIIRLYHKYFAKPEHHKLELIVEDAFSFLNNDQSSYDVIFIDLFDDLKTIDMVYTDAFSELLKRRLNPGGWILINTVESSDGDLRRTREFMLLLNTRFREVVQHRFHDLNRIIYAK